MSKYKKTTPIRDRFQLENDEDVDQHNAGRNQRQRASEHNARHFADLADVARQKLPPEVVAKYTALGGSMDAETLALVEAMEAAETSAAATCEHYAVTAGGLIEGLHLHRPFLQEAQKMALDARKSSAAAFMRGRDGQPPTGTTINGNGREIDLLESVTVYATSRPLTRWVLDDSLTFDALASQFAADTHCDASEEPFKKSLSLHVPPQFKADCIAQMANDAGVQRKSTNYYVRELKATDPQLRDRLDKPDPVSVGLLLPVAFGSDVLVLKLCHGHAWALIEKYSIQLRECGIEEPWESTGTYL